MTTSSSQRFVLEAVRRCLPKTGTGVRLSSGASDMNNCHETDGRGGRTGFMSIKIEGVEPLIHVEFALLGDGDGITWNSCRCTISLSTGPDQKWEYFCERQEDGSLRVRTMVVMRRIRILTQLVDNALTSLGPDAHAIEKRLRNLGYSPDIEGVKQYIADTFALVDVEITMVTKHGSFLPEIRGVRGDNPDVDLRLFNPSESIRLYITDQLVPAGSSRPR